MSWTLPADATFEVKPRTDVFEPSGGWGKAIPAVSPWATKTDPRPAYAEDEALKKLFGAALGRNENNAFKSACEIFPQDTNAALWIANHWLADPIVMGARDIYLKTVEAQSLLLDKDEFAAMLLKTATEKNLDKTRYAIEAKERVNILKLYAEVRGFLNKNETNINNFNNNEGLKVVFVKSEPLQPKTINQVPNEKSEILNEVPLPLNIKLVSNG
jgi:hypothetical protein